MRIAPVVTVFSALVLAVTTTVRAQDAPKAGIAAGYPGGIGVLWHVTDSVAVRPMFSFSHSSTDSSSSTSSGSGGGVDVSVLFYAKKKDTVRFYVSPRVAFSHTSSTITPSLTTLPPGVTPTTFTSTGNTVGGFGTAGAQYTPTRHFAIYGEVGLGVSHNKSKSSSVSSTTVKGTAWGTVAGVGVVIYP